AASAAGALIGAAMMVVAAGQLDRLGYLGSGDGARTNLGLWLEDPRQAAAAIGLITVVGIVVQWTLLRAKADRK
ncbi:MAG: hypothetical protein IT442_13410, partial [Phycisphaeraceae bacterium]|nr:hypothetical protein [Phycisphaeraceae bacterium]